MVEMSRTFLRYCRLAFLTPPAQFLGDFAGGMELGVVGVGVIGREGFARG